MTRNFYIWLDDADCIYHTASWFGALWIITDLAIRECWTTLRSSGGHRMRNINMIRTRT